MTSGISKSARPLARFRLVFALLGVLGWLIARPGLGAAKQLELGSIELEVIQAPGAHRLHPSAMTPATLRSALLADGNLTASEIDEPIKYLVSWFQTLAPNECIRMRKSGAGAFLLGGGEYILSVERYQERATLIIANVDGARELSRSTFILPSSNPSPPRVERLPAIPLHPVATAASLPALPLAPAPKSPIALQPQPKSVALIIGIEKYRDVLSVDYAKRDAERMAAYFRQLGLSEDRVALLVENHAGRADINKYLDNWLPRQTSGAERVYFYFSGHGSPSATGVQYLLPYDGDPRYLVETGLAVEDLLNRLHRLKVSEIVVILDACFSGQGRSAAPRGVRFAGPIDLIRLPRKTAAQTLLLFAAAGSQQTAGPHPSLPAGLFTEVLLDALTTHIADLNQDGRLSAQEIFDFIRPRIQEQAQKDNRVQIPELRIRNQSKRSGGIPIISFVR